jgi:hypothetical protein
VPPGFPCHPLLQFDASLCRTRRGHPG